MATWAASVSVGLAPTTYAAASPWAAAATVLAAAGLLVGAVVVLRGARTRDGSLSRRWRALATLSVLLAAAWLAPLVVGQQEWPELARSLAMVSVPFVLPLLVHLLVVVSREPDHRRPTGPLVGVAYVVTGGAVIVRAVFYDPLRDLDCWANCTVNAFLLRPLPGFAQAADVAILSSALLVSAVAVALGVRRMVTATPTARGRIGILLMPVMLAVAADGGYASLRLFATAEDPTNPWFAGVHLARAGSLLALGVGLVAVVVRLHDRRRAVDRLVEVLIPLRQPTAARDLLAVALSDPGVQVLYWLEERGQYVDAAGRFVEPPPGRPVTSVERGGRRVAAVVHDRVLDDPWRLGGDLGAATRLALDNERLRAAVLAQLIDLRASRARIVRAADESRSRIERDLHDGAQQSLVGLLFEVRMALAEAQDANHPDPAEVARLSAAVAEAEESVRDLRELAHGIYPAVLDEAGLGAALTTLAERALIPVRLESLPEERLDETSERTAYAVVQTIVDDLTREGVSALTVRVASADRSVRVEADAVPKDGYEHLTDRVGAVGGSVTVCGDRLTAEIPCAS
jgi:signal transduction histidine kinase